MEKNDWSGFWQLIFGSILAIVVLFGGCSGCSMGGKKSTVDGTLDTLDEYCDFSKIEFQDDTEEPRLKTITCHSKQRYSL